SNRHAAFMEQRCELVAKKDASLLADVIAAVQRYFVFATAAEAKTTAREMGIKGASYGARYIATKKSDDVIVGVKLLPEPSAPGP
ncbi:unnamed protein product, partial [Symbiodinium microadriaticum]